MPDYQYYIQNILNGDYTDEEKRQMLESYYNSVRSFIGSDAVKSALDNFNGSVQNSPLEVGSDVQTWPTTSMFPPSWGDDYNTNLGASSFDQYQQYQQDLHDALAENAAMYSDLIGKHNRGEPLTDYVTQYQRIDGDESGIEWATQPVRKKEMPKPEDYGIRTNTSFSPGEQEPKEPGFNHDASVSNSIYNMGKTVNSFYRRLNPDVYHNRNWDYALGTVGKIGSNMPGWAGVMTTGVATMAQLADNAIHKTVNNLNVDKDVMANLSASYGNYAGRVARAKSKQGKYSLFNSNKARKVEKEGNELNSLTGNLAAINNNVQDWNNLAMTGPWYAEGRRKQLEGYDNNLPIAAKQGTKLDTPVKEDAKSIVTHIEIGRPITSFKMGGAVNVIPEGALHARLHHMENDENITKKGIPVVSEREGGEMEQHAEIERQEIIFRLEVTKTLEELQKKYDSDEYTQKEKDEFALEAGKLLVEEILYNTIDNTNLINKI